MESTCPRIRLIRAISFCFSFSRCDNIDNWVPMHTVASCPTFRKRRSHGDEEEKSNRAPSEMSRQEMPLVYVGQYAHKRGWSARPIHQGSPRAIQRRHRDGAFDDFLDDDSPQPFESHLARILVSF